MTAAYRRSGVVTFCHILVLLPAAYFAGLFAPTGGKDKIKIGSMNQASLVVHNELKETIQILVQYKECHTCNLVSTRNISSMKTSTLFLDTRWETRLSVNSPRDADITYCTEEEISFHFLESGNYSLKVSQTKPAAVVRCAGPLLLNDPEDSKRPIYIGIFIHCIFFTLWILWKNLIRYLIQLRNFLWYFASEAFVHYPVKYLNPRNLRRGTSGDVGKQNPEELASSSARLKSLDTFRGISVTLMMIVHYGGGGYWFLLPTYWNGVTIADMIFPWLVFIMGTAVAISLRSQVRKATPKQSISFNIIKRSIVLFVLGLLVNSRCKSSNLSMVRVPGVLQRMSLAYLVVSLLHLPSVKGTSCLQHKTNGTFEDITGYWQEWIVQFIFAGIHLALTFGLPVPGCPTGYLGPGGLSDGGLYENCTGGAAGYIDKWIFTDKHIFQTPAIKHMYKTGAFDPEGTLGTLNTFLMCFLGLQAGKTILSFQDSGVRVRRFVFWSLFLMTLGGVLCNFSKHEGWIPVNKNLWSLPFVLVAAGFAFLLLTMCYLTIDVWKIWSGAPFYYPGLNSTAIYLGHELTRGRFPVNFKVPKDHGMMLAMAYWGTAIFVKLAHIMYKKKLFISI